MDNAKNVTVVPKQILLGDAEILTEGVTVEFITVIIIALDMATLLVAQAAFEVRVAVIISPFTNEFVV